MTPTNKATLTTAIDALVDEGYVVIPHAIANTDTESLLTTATLLHAQGQFLPAAIGRESGKHRDQAVRGDLSLWLDEAPPTPAIARFGALVDQIIALSRSELFVPAKRFEGHFAVYPAGAGYRAHLDQHAHSPHRQLSLVLYLSSLAPGDGGELKLHNTLNQKNTEIFVRPTAGTLVIFLSAKIVHEVLPTTRERWSLTGWIRDDEARF